MIFSFHDIKLLKVLFSEILAKYGIRCAFKNRINRAILFSFLADIFSKVSVRGTALYSYLRLLNNDMSKALRRYEYLQKNANELNKLSNQLNIYKIRKSSIIPKIYSLKQSWRKKIIIPRQFQQPKTDKKIFRSNILSNSYFRNESDHILHLITDDHEWSITPGKSEGKPYLSIHEAEIQLVEKGKLINQIAAECEIPWTHLIDIGSYLLIKKAAEYYPQTWGELVEKFHEFLTETILTGNDLGIHVHPDKSHLAAEKYEVDKIWIKEEVPTWGELCGVGESNNLESKLGLLLAGKKLVEEYGKLGNPNYKAVFFRAGKYSTGRNFKETCDSMEALWKAGLYICSDALLIDGVFDSLGRPPSQTVYMAKYGYPWKIAEKRQNIIHVQALPFRSKDFAYYSVIECARIYNKDSKIINRIIKEVSNGSKYIISMDHDIEIGNEVRGGRWDSLDATKGDWKYIKNYLIALKKTNKFRFINTQEFAKNLNLPDSENSVKD